MLGQLLRFSVFWFIGATTLGLLLGRMIKGPGETPAFTLKSTEEHTEAVEEKAG